MDAILPHRENTTDDIEMQLVNASFLQAATNEVPTDWPIPPSDQSMHITSNDIHMEEEHVIGDSTSSSTSISAKKSMMTVVLDLNGLLLKHSQHIYIA